MTDATYKVIRFYFKNGKRTIKTGLTLAQAQAHCQDPESSSSTAIGSAASAVTRRNGPWFDGYDKEK